MKELPKEVQLQMVAETLPTTPPLTPNGDLQFLDFVQDYNEEDKDAIWQLYVKHGGRMKCTYGITSGV